MHNSKVSTQTKILVEITIFSYLFSWKRIKVLPL